MDTPRPLPERPRAEIYSIEELLDHARRGRLRVPSIETGLRWRARHVVEVFDSVLRGFPIGSLLLWKRAAPAESIHFGPLVVQASASDDAAYVVDGQQRLTALVAAACG